MASTYSSLKFELISTGEQSGAWGDTTNTNIGTAIEQAIVGMATLDSGDFTANVATLTLSNSPAAQDARALCLNIAAGAVSAAGTINVPAIQKPYLVINGSSYTVTVKVSGQTGVAVPSGKRTVVYNNGTDVGTQLNWLASLDITTLNVTTVNSTTVDTTNLEVTNIEAKDGTAGMQIADSTGVVSFTANPVMSGGTANGVAYLNGSKVLTTGSALTFDGSTFGVKGSGQIAAIESTGNYSSSGAGFIRFKDSTGNRGYIGFGGTSNLMTVSNTVASAALNFELAGAERMRIDSTGLGIGTSSPAAKLDVAGNAIISTTDNTNAALRITQLGTGNALLVEDSSNPDSTPFVIDASGNAILGAASLVTYGGTTPALQVQGTAGNSSAISVASNSITQTRGGTAFFARSRGTTVGSTTIVSSDDRLASIIGSGADGAAFIQAATINIEVDGTPGTNDMPGRLVFSTTADGASTPTERMRIDNAGRVILGGSQAYAADGDTQQLQIQGLTQASSSASLTNWSATQSSEPNLVLAHSRSGAIGTHTASVANDNLGNITFCGSDGSIFNAGVAILAEADGTWSGSSTPARVAFFTVPSGSTSGVEAISLTSGQGLQISRTAVTSPVANDGNVFSGTYTPTLTNTTNVAASTAYACQYMRVGNVVTVSGRVNIDATTTATNTILGVSLPVASNFASAQNAGGAFSPSAATQSVSGVVYADATNDRVSFRILIDSAAASDYYFTFTYQVI